METLVSIALIVMACATVHIACHMPQSAEHEHEERVSRERRDHGYARQLKGSVGSTFEFGLKDVSPALGSLAGGAASVRGRVLDCDDEWVLISFERSHKTVRAMLRFSQIENLKELCP